MRRCIYLTIVLMLAACGSPALPTPISVDANPSPLRSVSEIGRGDFDGATITVIAPVVQRSGGRTLVPALSFTNADPTPLLGSPGESVLLGGDPLTGLTVVPSDGSEYGVVRATGIIQVTADGIRQIQPSTVKVLAPTSLTLADLQANSATYSGQIVALKGSVVVKPGAALLVDAVGPGGVPNDTAAQIKIAQPFADAALIERLPQHSGDIRYGPISVVGLWRGQSLTIFWATID
jgi:hypothetical protein